MQLSGLGLIGACLWIRFDPRFADYVVFVNEDSANWLTYVFKGTLFGLIGVGAFVGLSGFLGCCGAIRESRWMVGMYMALLVLVMIVELGGGILAVIYRQKIETAMDGALLTQIRNSYGLEDTVTTSIDNLQSRVSRQFYRIN